MSNFVKPELIFLDETFTKKDDLLVFLSDQAAKAGIATDAASAKAAFDQREAEMSTGVVDGFAIPHAKSDAITKASVIVIRSSKIVEDWESIDEKPINIAIALLVPGEEAGTTHVKLLSKVAVMLMDESFRDFVRAASDPVAVADEINGRLDSALAS